MAPLASESTNTYYYFLIIYTSFFGTIRKTKAYLHTSIFNRQTTHFPVLFKSSLWSIQYLLLSPPLDYQLSVSTTHRPSAKVSLEHTWINCELISFPIFHLLFLILISECIRAESKGAQMATHAGVLTASPFEQRRRRKWRSWGS